MVPIVEVSNIHTFYGSSHILHGVSLTLNAGEIISLLGRNGMGKTTLLKSIMGLNPPKKGSVTFFGQNMTNSPVQKIAQQGIAFVPEHRGIFPNLSVLENLIMAAAPGVNGKEEWNLNRILDTFPQLQARLNHMGNQLSGGEQQMASIARALMTNPRVLLLDEVTEGLAPLVCQNIWSVIQSIKETGIAALIVDKDINALLHLTDQNVIIEKGKVVYEGNSQALKHQPDILHRYLGL
ncbi:MAG: ABC transporter ATP-binding protein [SAR324 cluster bacterium]|nr:ABC transporter ATP-binding protein [SAR324 cluster bacterium]